MRSTLMFLGILAAAPLLASHAKATQAPGNSGALHDTPYYACKTNVYVASNGNDADSGTSPASAWATLQHANNALPGGGAAAGTCINVGPGTYSGVTITHGGNLAASNGYVVYRCSALHSCTVLGNAGKHGAEAFETQWNTSGTPPNYIMIDGFVISGGNSSVNGVGIGAWNGNNGSAVASHHIWVLNNRIFGFGQSGIGVAASEYYYIIHNRIWGNSNLNCGAQGSGIAINIMHSVPNYTPTADDVKNPNPLLGPSWAIGNSFFHNVIAWNVVNDNALTRCGTASHPSDTDGNGIIFDSNLTGNGDTQDYTSPSLVAFNLVYNNGSGGVHLFYSADVTIANNTCYNSQIDPGNGGTGRSCLDDSEGFGDTFINNIAVSVPATGGKCWTTPITPPFAMYNAAVLGAPNRSPVDTFTNNLSHITGANCWGNEALMWNGDTYSCKSNICSTDPAWVSVGTLSTGTDEAKPVNANFALQPGSPAIGKGLSEPYLYASSVDLGACASTLQHCW